MKRTKELKTKLIQSKLTKACDDLITTCELFKTKKLHPIRIEAVSNKHYDK